MTWYTLTEIAASYNRSVNSTRTYILNLISEGKFKKKSPGKKYTEEELHKLEKLLGFTYKRQD